MKASKKLLRAGKRPYKANSSEITTRSVRAHVMPLPDAKVDDEPELKPVIVATNCREARKGEEDIDMEAVDSDLATFLAKKTLEFPKEMPVQYTFSHDNFYVRECYADYYDKGMGQIYSRDERNRIRGVTVTGTPGTGKSAFMAYFFLRYRIEHKNNPIILVSYTNDSEMCEVAVWENGDFKNKFESQVAMDELLAKHRGNPNFICLIDGPLSMAPVVNRYVVFTSPKERWLSDRAKDITHFQLYMPVWDAEEMMDAVEALNLHITHQLDLNEFPRKAGRHGQEVMYRYDVFGGVARSCLVCDGDAVFLATQLNVLELAINSVDIATGWSMNNGEDFQDKRHELYHYIV